MTGELAAVALVLVGPAGLLLALFAVAALVIASLGEADAIIEDQARLAGP